MPTNYAAVATGAGQPLQVVESPYPHPGPNEIVIENKAIAINPADWKLSQTDLSEIPLFRTLQYPFILGEDCAGIVSEVGSGVTSVVKGDRVMAATNGVIPQINERGGFQKYVLVPEPNFGKIPENVPFEEAVVLPIGLMTGAAGLFEKDRLGMTMPPSTKGNGKTLLVWGGSSCCGVNATQLAAAAGYEVISVASRHNFDLCKSVGASQVFDYNDENFINEVSAAMEGKDSVGCYNAIGSEETCKLIFEIITKSGTIKRLTSVSPGTEAYAPDGFEMTCIASRSEDWPSIATYLFNWASEAMEKGIIKTKPDPLILGKGLEYVQKGIEDGMKGYSGTKLVVTL